MKFRFDDDKGAWMKECGATTLAYISKPYGDVVLIRWESGDVTVLRDMAGAGVPITTTVSAECLGKIDELRGRLNPDEVSLAAGESKWEHPGGGTIQTTTTVTTKRAKKK